MKLLDKTDIEQLTEQQVRDQLDYIEKSYDLDKPLYPVVPIKLKRFDDIANNLLWLEDRLEYFRLVNQLTSYRNQKNGS